MKPIDIYLNNRGVNIHNLSGEEYSKLEKLHTDWVINNNAALEVLKEKSYSPYSSDYKYIYFTRQAEINKGMLEDEIMRIKNNNKVRK